jgi:hypothetical protein
MVRQYRKFDEDFKSGAVWLVFETGKPISQVARDLGSTRARWATGSPPGGPAIAATGRPVRTSGPNWRGCAGRTPSCGCSVMCSSARWPSG